MKTSCSLRDFVADLQARLAAPRSDQHVSKYLAAHVIAPAEVIAREVWQAGTYTRNILHHEKRFEVVLLCWDSEAVTPVHDHGGQRCWTQVVGGRLRCESFRYASPRRRRRHAAAALPVMQADGEICLSVGDVDYLDTLAAMHRVSNPGSFNGRALSVHVYAGPLGEYSVYDPSTGLVSNYVPDAL